MQVITARKKQKRSKRPPSYISQFAEQHKRNPTSAEAEFCAILDGLNGGVLVGRYRTQHVISGRWIVDFFFPENRLAIEIDGLVHETVAQRARDKLKDTDCTRFDITLLRIANDEVYGDRDLLTQKLRDGWLRARQRENKIIGQPYI